MSTAATTHRDDLEADNESNEKKEGELHELESILNKQTAHVVNNSMYYEFQVPEKLNDSKKDEDKKKGVIYFPLQCP